MKRFIEDIKKYSKYIKYSTKSQLKAEVIGSYLSWIWLFLEPICFMLIYTFIAQVVFKASEDYFAIFVFIGLTIWSFFNKTLVASIRLVLSNRDTVTKVYVPKFVLLLTRMCVNSVKFFISFSLVIICMIIYQVPISFNILWFIPIFITLFLFTFGISLIFMHLGVFIQDLAKVTNIALRLMFYASGVFFALDKRISPPWNEILIVFNPLAAIITQCRNALLYCQSISFSLLGSWFLIGLILTIIGIKTIYKYENTYVKVMR